MTDTTTKKTVSNSAVPVGFIRSLFKQKNKKLEKEKLLKKDIIKRQKVLQRKEIVQSWNIVFGDEKPKKKKDIHVIRNITARNVWMEEFFLFNQIKSLKPDEFFHPVEVYALKWQPQFSLFRILIPLNDPKVQENAITVLSKMTFWQRRKMIFHFSPITTSTPIFAEKVHPASLVSYRTKNAVLKKLSQCFIEGKIAVEEIKQVFTCGHDVWNSALYNLLSEDEQVYHRYLNEKRAVEVDQKAISRMYIDGDISLQQYDELKFPDRKRRNDIIAQNYPLPVEGETCIVCSKEGVGVIKCQNCINMVCCDCIRQHFGSSEEEDEWGNVILGQSKGSFLLLHHKYCMKLGKLQDLHPPIVQEPAYLRKFRETSRTAVLARLNPPKKEEFRAEEVVDEEEDDEERAYRLQQEQYARERQLKEQQRLAIENPPALYALRERFQGLKKKYAKSEKEITDLQNKINDTSHTEQFIKRNIRLKNEAVTKLFKTVREPLNELRAEGDGLNIMSGEYIENFYREVDKILKMIEMFTITE